VADTLAPQYFRQIALQIHNHEKQTGIADGSTRLCENMRCGLQFPAIHPLFAEIIFSCNTPLVQQVAMAASPSHKKERG
jgi:hypothetical protein